MGLLDGRPHLGTDGIDHAREAHEGEVVLEIGGIIALRSVRSPVTACGGHDAQRLVGHGLVLLHDLRAQLIGHGDDAGLGEVGGAAREHDVGATLGMLHDRTLAAHDDRHHLACGVKGRLAYARAALVEVGRGEAHLGGIGDEGGLGGLTLRNAICGVPLRVGGKSHAAHVGAEVLGRVLDDGHLVLRERARLIRADYLRTS